MRKKLAFAQRFSRAWLLLGMGVVVVPFAIAQTAGLTGHLPEPIQVAGGEITAPPIQWMPGVRLYRGIPYAAPPVGTLR